jgi:hypothetical protein
MPTRYQRATFGAQRNCPARHPDTKTSTDISPWGTEEDRNQSIRRFMRSLVGQIHTKKKK